MIRHRRGLKAGDVVWAGAYPGLLVRKKNSNRWAVEFFGYSNQVGSEKLQNIVALHIGDYVPCPRGETAGLYADAIQEAMDYMDRAGNVWGSEGRRTVPPKFFQKFGLRRRADVELDHTMDDELDHTLEVAVDQTLDEDLDQTIEEEYEVGIGIDEPKKKSASSQIIVSVAIFVLAVVWYFMK
ncbi:hypothetical protein B9Z55_028670 [Caenorhabditis nigoni]|nr:hypothetical protein B9Z55_028665 [Caenorhabditis nigoni]PIC12047.1 hypothetical protein B9Z55_028670 [Caenorhabditis nigoni]